MKRSCLLLALLVTLCGCESSDEKNSSASVENSSAKGNGSAAALPVTKEKGSTDPPGFSVDESGLAGSDFETAYELCAKALSDYYKAVWNGSEIDLAAYIDNNSLNLYMEKKIAAQYELFLKNSLVDNRVTNVAIGARKAEYAGGDKSYIYLELDARVEKDVGSYAEPTEFLVHRSNGKAVIVDWYGSGKDSYDSIVRGHSQSIDNPDIWNDSDWVEKVALRTD
ncbi:MULTISPECIES: hypothetical protein [unclassified Paenibacillus]|uniref:hypothetical protein n=1 Tax=unclassified Paenibacillus TaxID=185978 RepID=UPI00095635F6|nr:MULTISPECIES: hypothetical protein [unclassified Paenibacillus]ASS68267.1 hypothetical protein CIC07_20645 [Paenibacillus sp. RUD330]SIR26716.1 hypothetical protein SAMN05880555_3317 [Paenibacillus sp. RU4X]SIR39541.1 hypothetical protein SAMN05880570_3318 [Paenibacillus sp. RU4T]